MDIRDNDILDFIFGTEDTFRPSVKTVADEKTYVLDPDKYWLLNCALISY